MQSKLNKKSIDQLIAMCAHNDEQAQMEVYHRYHQAMFVTALKIVHNKMDAEDVMQDSFLIAFQHLSQYRGENNFGGWLKKIVINKGIEYHRNKKKKLKLVKEHKPDAYENETNETKKLIHNELLVALKSLKPRYKNALSLMYLEGYDYEELMEILNLSYGNCRTLISRAKEKLKEKMKPKTPNKSEKTYPKSKSNL